jgi:hypothetical protein
MYFNPGASGLVVHLDATGLQQIKQMSYQSIKEHFLISLLIEPH